MQERIDEEVSVLMYYKASKKEFIPHLLSWKNKDYLLDKPGYKHSYMDGQERQHIFELCDKEQTLNFRLRFNTANLHWILESVHDGNPN
jgi:hypothetical protein